MEDFQTIIWVLIILNGVVGALLIPALLSWIRVNNAKAKLTEYKLQEYETDQEED